MSWYASGCLIARLSVSVIGPVWRISTPTSSRCSARVSGRPGAWLSNAELSEPSCAIAQGSDKSEPATLRE